MSVRGLAALLALAFSLTLTLTLTLTPTFAPTLTLALNPSPSPNPTPDPNPDPHQVRGLAARRACPPPFFFELSTLLPLHIHSAASLGACLAAAQHGSLAQPLDRLCEAMQQQGAHATLAAALPAAAAAARGEGVAPLCLGLLFR